MDKYQEMRVFAAVVEASSFVAAADSLGMSKAAVSRHVAELEQRLGVRLMHRTTRKLSLTPEGGVFLARCRDILSSIEASEAEISTHSVTVGGLLKLSVPVSFGIRHLAPLWHEFLALHPQVSLDVQLADRVIDLIDEGFDLAIRIARLPDSTLISRQIASTRLVLCAAPGYLRRRGAPKHPSDLAEHDVLGYSLLATGDQWQFAGPHGPISIKVRPRIWSNNGDTCIAACLHGAGIQLQPTFLIDRELRAGDLVEVLPEFRAITMGIYAVYPTRRFVLPKVRALVDFLNSRLKNEPWNRSGIRA
ncbi:LysR family transcriptional regulator [Accumulibacter sp.]|uniref:LysR family transcriptional regulator n=2 Tax=Accumulibacter sp. TaxID=2053492 RepID=UPI002879C866|nr:LysR family transcriptional regulator [Accumulibacter sp.]MDS4055635.1 LysR family transcriptional regulator [Accumulibacter sp.]HNC27646.1 LysR family transcriptional regulator [Accumulibacter sp.]HNE40584.1 LysR family transcriptional regulator [Accumulibacter sp.]HNH92437.1 LysR family transcriptional regulator [Accumulibacter sp.]HNJ51270.1 LysR family transcriptional regulator [Accumulibacter sp.]